MRSLRRTSARALAATMQAVPCPLPRCRRLVLRPWFGPWERNAQLCKSCMKSLTKRGVGGAEVELSLLFADIRGSTGLGERLRPPSSLRC